MTIKFTLPEGHDGQGAEIIDLRPGQPRLEVKQRVYSGCQHVAVLVDEVLRRVTCKTCDELLDPVEVLLEYAHHERRLACSTTSAFTKRNVLRAEVEALKKERANLKAAIRRGKVESPRG
jgi:hypothetical protein